MATRSTIAVVHNDDTVSQIYCHWDGYLEHNGKLLQKWYNNIDTVEKLIAQGDLSALGMRIDPNPNFAHTRSEPQKDVCLYYGRDLNEQDSPSVKYKNYQEYCSRNLIEEYDYLFTNGKWYVECDETKRIFMPLAIVLEQMVIA